MNLGWPLAVLIDVPQRIVQSVTVTVPTLRVRNIDARALRVGTCKPSLRPREVPSPEVIEVGLGISFLGSKLLRRKIRRCRIRPTRKAIRTAVRAGGDVLA